MRFLVVSVFALFVGSTPLYSQMAANFTAKDIEGKEHQLYQYLDKGQYVLMDFFSST